MLKFAYAPENLAIDTRPILGHSEFEGVKNLIVPLAACLKAYYDATHDDGRISTLLSPFTASLRAFADAKSKIDAKKPAEWEQTFRDLNSALSKEFSGYHPEACEALKQTKHLKDIFKGLRTKDWRESPYLAIIISSLLSYQHEYLAATTNINRWLDSHKPPMNGDPEKERDRLLYAIFTLRARGATVTFMEEWLHGAEAIRPNATLLDFHRYNIEQEISVFEQNRDLSRIVNANANAMHVDDASSDKEISCLILSIKAPAPI